MYSVIESKLASYSIARQPSSTQASSLGLSQNPSSARAFIRHHIVTPLESLLRLEPLVSDSPMPLQDIQPSLDVSRIPFYTILHTSQSIVHPISLSILVTRPAVENFIGLQK